MSINGADAKATPGSTDGHQPSVPDHRRRSAHGAHYVGELHLEPLLHHHHHKQPHNHPKQPHDVSDHDLTDVSDSDESESDGEEPWYAKGLWQTPRVLHDWDNPMKERTTTFTELYCDLIFVSVVARLGESLRGEDAESMTPVDEYILLFLSLFYVWSGLTIYSTRWLLDDLFHKLFFAVLMVFVVGMALHIQDSPRGGNSVPYAFSAFGARLVLIFANLRVAYHVPRSRSIQWMTSVPDIVTAGCWLAAALTTDPDTRTKLYWAAVVVDPCRYMLVEGRKRLIKCKILKSATIVPLHIDHIQERMGLFTILVLGEQISACVVNPVNANATESWRLYSTTFLVFVSAFCLKIMYFDCHPVEVSNHPLRVSSVRGITFLIMHSVLSCALALTGSGMLLINTLALGEGGEEPVVPDHRTARGREYFGHGLSIALLCLTILMLLCRQPASTWTNPVLRCFYITQIGSQLMGSAVISACVWLTSNTYKGSVILVGVAAVVLVVLVAVNLCEELYSFTHRPEHRAAIKTKRKVMKEEAELRHKLRQAAKDKASLQSRKAKSTKSAKSSKATTPVTGPSTPPASATTPVLATAGTASYGATDSNGTR